ncbi:MAG TPA: hydrogenase maturation nickel metallochaperone HypA [Bacillota bacterium]|nr:hydrogenase maturation nickel metallochaperone HypA [Bacillota bacterium]
MHEMSLMEGIFNIIGEAIEGRQVSRVTKVSLKVGVLTNAVPEALQMCFQFYARGTPVEGGEMVIEEVPLVIKCGECGAEQKLDEPVFLCPNCESARVDTISGRELLVESLEVE